MLRSRWRRLLATLTGTWVLVIAASPVPLWSCPEHGSHHAAMSHDMGHMDHHAPASHSHQCTCPGCCCGVAAVSLTPGRLVSLPVVPVAIVAQATTPTLGPPRERAPHLRLPLPLGPPAIRV